MRILIVLSVVLWSWSWSLPGYPMLPDRPEVMPLDTLVEDTLAADSVEPPGFFVVAEDSLKTLALDIVRPLEDSARLANNQLFANYLLEVLHEKNSMRHPFDSLITVSMLQPPDSAFRIITWYVPLSNQQFRYFGYVQYGDSFAGSAAMPYRESGTDPSDERGVIYPLREDAGVAGDATAVAFTGSNWYGCYYYELITNRHAGEYHYMLLGWRGDNAYSRKRIVEPLSFRDREPVFGAQVFDLEGREPYRLVFEYSVRVSMGLLYDELYSRMRRTMTPMIVFDRLMPMQENLKGQYQYYVPLGEVFDGLIFMDGRWLLEEDVDARNRKRQEKP